MEEKEKKIPNSNINLPYHWKFNENYNAIIVQISSIRRNRLWKRKFYVPSNIPNLKSPPSPKKNKIKQFHVPSNQHHQNHFNSNNPDFRTFDQRKKKKKNSSNQPNHPKIFSSPKKKSHYRPLDSPRTFGREKDRKGGKTRATSGRDIVSRSDYQKTACFTEISLAGGVRPVITSTVCPANFLTPLLTTHSRVCDACKTSVGEKYPSNPWLDRLTNRFADSTDRVHPLRSNKTAD